VQDDLFLLTCPKPGHFRSILHSLDTGSPFVFHADPLKSGTGDPASGVSDEGYGDVGDNSLCPPSAMHSGADERPAASENAHSMAHALLRFLDSLPEPVIPYPLYPNACAAEDAEAAYSVRDHPIFRRRQRTLTDRVTITGRQIYACRGASLSFDHLIRQLGSGGDATLTRTCLSSTLTRSWPSAHLSECSRNRRRRAKLVGLGWIGWVR
jgi:hypothetical protein